MAFSVPLCNGSGLIFSISIDQQSRVKLKHARQFMSKKISFLDLPKRESIYVAIACSKNKVVQRAERGGIVQSQSLARAIVHLFFWAEGDRRVSHATLRHPAGHPRKGAIAAGKEGLAIGINYCEWRGLCLLFSPLFLKEATEGKNSTPTTGCPLHFWKGFAFQVTNLTSLLSPTLKALFPLLWNALGFCCPVGTRECVSKAVS